MTPFYSLVSRWSFRAKKTVERDDDILIRTDGDKIVGITILDASSI